VQLGTLISAVRTALRARDRQYQIRGYLKERAEAEEALRLADQRKDEFLATLGHELRNPLTPLLMGLQLLKSSGSETPGNQASDARVKAVMERQINHLVRLVDDLLEVSRITRLVDIQHEPLDLSAVRSIQRPAGPLDAPPQLVVDSRAHHRCRRSCVSRRCSRTCSQCREVPIRRHIRLPTRRRCGVRRDNGIGSSRPASRSSTCSCRSTDQTVRQAGSASASYCAAWWATRRAVEATAAPARGEFVVGCRCAERVGKAVRRSSRCRRAHPVRDEHGESLAMLLRVLGAEVALAHSGRVALECVDSFQPDVVLLDIGMPGMDGYEVARRIRANPEHRHISLIALTGWGQDEDRKRSVAAGFNHHLVKPADIDQLRQLLMVA
jgi:CheY-like chemotaxis protein